MKTIRLIPVITIALLLSIFTPTRVKATHAAGGEIVYEWVSDSTYRVFFKFYRDCTGIQEPDILSPPQLCVMNPYNPSLSQNLAMQKVQGTLPDGSNNGDPVTTGCFQYPTQCSSPTSPIPGYREWWYSALVTLGGKCDFWTFSTSISARNPSTNTNGTSGGNLYVETTLNNVLFQGNSSPYFTAKPTPYFCINSFAEFNNGAIDVDGDSIVSEVVQPQNGGCGWSGSLVPISTGITYPANPLPTNNLFAMNGKTGQMSFIPTQQGVHTITTKVSEYRNGIKVGHIIRDVQMAILNCSSKKPSLYLQTPTGGGIDSTTTPPLVYGCAGEQLSFCYDVISDPRNRKLIVRDNYTFAVPGASTAYYNQVSDSVRGCFTWTPGSNDTGLRGFIILVKDSSCPPPGIMLSYNFAIPIYVLPAVRTFATDDSVCPGKQVMLAAIGGNSFVWDVLPGGDAVTNLSCTNCSQTTTIPKLTTTYTVTSATGTACGVLKDTVTVVVLPAPTIIPMPDTGICAGSPITLKTNTTPQAGVAYSYKWQPATFLNKDTDSTPITRPTTDITYIVAIKGNNSVCEATDTIDIKVDIKPDIRYNGTIAHYGDTTRIKGLILPVNQTYSLAWTPANLLDDPGAKDPLFTPTQLGRVKLTLIATTLAGCSDTVDIFVDVVWPVSVANDVIVPNPEIDIPNAFVPNGINNTLKISRMANATLKSFAVYNRAGVKMFQTSDVNEGWDGRFNGEPQPMGVYIYTIEAQTAAGEPLKKQGNITLVK